MLLVAGLATRHERNTQLFWKFIRLPAQKRKVAITHD